MLDGTGCYGKQEAIITDSGMIDVWVIERGQEDRVGKADSNRYANGCSENIKIRLISIPAIILTDWICVPCQ